MADQIDGLPYLPVYRNFVESLENQVIGQARTKQEALKVAIGAGVRGLKHGGEPKLLDYIGGRVWLLEDV